MATYYRCRHCRGFYDSSLPACRYCGKATFFTDSGGVPILYPDRETCRAIQIAEYERLPEEAHADCMEPPADELATLCGCLHCGPEGAPFEAVEMRWHLVEKMWCCPCTTCGGRGFEFDVFPIQHRWECAECRHKWAPADGNFKPSNCKCPKCGCTEASGYFEDEYSEEEIEAMSDAEYEAYFGCPREDDFGSSSDFTATSAFTDSASPGDAGELDKIPFDDEDEADEDATTNIPGLEYATEHPNEEQIRDDIDHPRIPKDRPSSDGPPLADDDIPY